MDIYDLLSPGDPHNCTFDVYTHLGQGVLDCHFVCRLPTGHNPEIRTAYLYICPLPLVLLWGDVRMNNFYQNLHTLYL